MTPIRYFTASEAASALGISLPTLYAYVSRGLVRSEAAGNGRRDRRYRREDVDYLRARQDQRRNPDRAAEQALTWGVPVLESKLTLIADGRLYYRGQDALNLARTKTFEEVAELLWLVPEAGAAEVLWPVRADLLAYQRWLKCLPEAGPVDTMQALLPVAAAHDAAAYDLRPAAVAQAGARILALLAAAAVYPSAPAPGSIADCLGQGWSASRSGGPGSNRTVRLVNAALILSADHELNTSAFTARCVASARSTPYQVVIAGLAALRGQRHGGLTARVEALIEDVGVAKGARLVIGDWLRRGDALPGFGHPLYPDGDPRASALLELARAALPRSRELALAQAIAQETMALVGQRPTIDFALVAVARALRLPRGAALAIFAVGRAAGWIAHAMEQYQTEAMIRPRARYVGEMPG